MGKKIEVDNLTIENIKNLYKNTSYKKIAPIVGLTPGVVFRIIRENEFKKGSPKEKISISKEELYDLYENKKYSMTQIASMLKCDKKHVSSKLKEYNIPIHHVGSEPIPFTKELLKDLYVNKKMTQKQIAEKMGCGVPTVGKYLKKYDIKERHNAISVDKLKELFLSGTTELNELSAKMGVSEATIKLRLIELGLLKNNKSRINQEELLELVLKGFTISEIVSKLKSSKSTIARELQKLGVKPKRYTLENVTYETLYNLLITQNLKISEVASMYYVSESTLKSHLIKLNLSIIKEKAKLREQALSEETLRELYFNKNMSQKEIASYLGVDRGHIVKKFKEYNINKPFKFDYITLEDLEELYIKQNLPPCLIAEKFNCKPGDIQRKINKYNLKKQKTPEEVQAYRNRAYEISLNTQRSKGEKELQELFYTPYHNDHSTINLELDLWYPEKRVAIEYNGDFWHSTDFPQNSGLHIAKYQICKNKGIQLINIFERDWHAARSKKLLKVHLGRILTPEKFKKPEGTVSEISLYQEKVFENKYNLEGTYENEKAVGIKQDGTIVASLGYSISNNICVVNRFTTHPEYLEDYTILIQYLKETYKLPVRVKYDNRYYLKFPVTQTPRKEWDIAPEIFYVKSRKALREWEVSEEFKNHSKCRKVYDCGYTCIEI